MLSVNKSNSVASLTLGNNSYTLTLPRTLSERQTGLLNHIKMPEKCGLLYKKGGLFHTMGMRFPITVAALDKAGKLIAPPVQVDPGCVFVAPLRAAYTVELASVEHGDLSLLPIKGNKTITVVRASRFLSLLKHALNPRTFVAILALALFSLTAFATGGKSLRMDFGKQKRLDLGEAPRSIEVANPDIVDVERIGLTNAINIVPKSFGSTTLTVRFPRGSETTYQIQVGGDSPRGSGFSNAGSARLARDIQRLAGLETSVDDGKVLVTGHISSMDVYRGYIKLIAARPQLFVPAFTISSHIEPAVLGSVKEDLALLGETKLNLISRGGLIVLGGIASSTEGKARALAFVNAAIPNLIDATETMSGNAAVVQVNLQFLEVGKSGQTGFGFKVPGAHSPVSGSASFGAAKNIANAAASPSFQIAPVTAVFQALQERAFARELASPVILTRSSERATFLAGGEIPLSIMTDKGPRLEFKPYGISMAVTPKIQPDASVWLDLDMEVSSVQSDIVVQGNPAFSSRRLNTNVVLQEGNAAILSGLVKQDDSKSVEKFPILGSIPILGELFKSRHFKDSETELWVAVTVVGSDKTTRRLKSLKEMYDEFGKSTRGSLLD